MATWHSLPLPKTQTLEPPLVSSYLQDVALMNVGDVEWRFEWIWRCGCDVCGKRLMCQKLRLSVHQHKHTAAKHLLIIFKDSSFHTCRLYSPVKCPTREYFATSADFCRPGCRDQWRFWSYGKWWKCKNLTQKVTEFAKNVFTLTWAGFDWCEAELKCTSAE